MTEKELKAQRTVTIELVKAFCDESFKRKGRQQILPFWLIDFLILDKKWVDINMVQGYLHLSCDEPGMVVYDSTAHSDDPYVPGCYRD